MAKAAQRRSVVEGWRRSEEPLTRYCARLGVSMSSFYRWRRTVNEAPQGKPRFVPVSVVEPSAASAVPAKHETAGVWVVLENGRRLDLARGFCPATLRAAVSALEGLQ